jgi:hypothetical protein
VNVIGPVSDPDDGVGDTAPVRDDAWAGAAAVLADEACRCSVGKDGGGGAAAEEELVPKIESNTDSTTPPGLTAAAAAAAAEGGGTGVGVKAAEDIAADGFGRLDAEEAVAEEAVAAAAATGLVVDLERVLLASMAASTIVGALVVAAAEVAAGAGGWRAAVVMTLDAGGATPVGGARVWAGARAGCRTSGTLLTPAGAPVASMSEMGVESSESSSPAIEAIVTGVAF